jgi:pyruvate formate lyase activating enzyme
MQTRKEVWLLPVKCIKCGECVHNCPSQSLSLASGSLTIDRSKCTGCYTCANACPAKAIEKIGEEYTPEEILKIILKDKIYFETSGGGITVTGGEPGLYYEFISELFKMCQKEGIQTAFDTSGSIPKKALEAIIPFSDIVFLDFKIWETESSLFYTSLNPDKVKTSLLWIKKFRNNHNFPKLQIRTPLIPGATDNEKNLMFIGNFITEQDAGLVELWELCMFNDLCEDKYQKLNKNWTFKGQKHTLKDFEKFCKLKLIFPNLNIEINGFYEK